MTIDERELRRARRRVVAAIDVQVRHITIDRRKHLRAFEIELRGIERGLRLLQLRLGGRGRLRCVLALFLRYDLAIQIRAACGIGAAHAQFRLPRGDVRLRLLHGDPGTRRIHLHQQIAFLHELVVGERHRHDRARYVRRHVDDVGADAAVARPRLVHVVDPERAAYQDGCGEDGCREDETHDFFQ